MSSVDRVLLTCEVLRGCSGPVCAGSLAMTLAERVDRPPSKRTVLRDLRALSRRGFVTIASSRKGFAVLWEWVESNRK